MFRNNRTPITLAVLFLLTLLAVTPAGAQESCNADATAIFEAMAAVGELDVPVEGALLVELASAMTSLATGDTEAAISDLEAFLKKVEAQSGKQIDAAAAVELVSFAQGILNNALCPCTDLWTDYLDQLDTYLTQLPWLDGLYWVTKIRESGVRALWGSSPGVGEWTVFGIDAFAYCGSSFFFLPPGDVFISMETQAEVDACTAVMEGIISSQGCPLEDGVTCAP